ncbi:MAG: imidazole glycerol phosphate synthase subunit HisH [Eggerthellaceae bacterium]|nr:imidazole glycerol phosphate synthase subunit HisH [Eggerthellaceae bacterium]
MIAIVDYAKGNLQSVQKGLEAAGARDARIVTAPDDIAAADAVVLPGVGAFADASRSMIESGQMDAVRNAIQEGKPFLGICLGLHLLFEAGTEHAVEGEALPEGLGIIPGVCERIPKTNAAGDAFKVPQMGWNSIEFVVLPNNEMGTESSTTCESSPARPSSPLLDGIREGEFFYFTHSYIAPDNPYTQATTTHSSTFPCFVDVGGTCFGIQFHPEKSSDAGIHVLRNFVKVVEG